MSGIPFPFKRRIFPGCVPGSIFTFTFPSSVGISTESPNTASGKPMKVLYNRSFPSRTNSGCSISSINMMRSPFTPPRRAAFPFPLKDNCMPSATPAGIFKVITSSESWTPSPLQWEHFSLIILPSPSQVGQVDVVCMAPRMVFCTRVICPVPWQVEQVEKELPSFAPVPWQWVSATYFFTLIFFSTPVATSSRVIFTFTLRLVPRFTRLAERPPPPKPPKPPKLPKISPKCAKMSSILIPAPPKPPAPAPIPACPNWS